MKKVLLVLAIWAACCVAFTQGATIAMTDTQAYTKAAMVFGANARTSIMRTGSTKITRCVGYEAFGIPKMTCVQGTWEQAFAAVPTPSIDPALPNVIIIDTHIQCLSDPSKTTISTAFGIGTLIVPNPAGDCFGRLWYALQETRLRDVQTFDATLAKYDLWLKQ
jgi:hypothetical protein